MTFKKEINSNVFQSPIAPPALRRGSGGKKTFRYQTI